MTGMTAIAQMQVRFDPGEDRLLLRVRSGDGGELRFWLTRRYLRLAWPLLARHLDSTPAAAGVNPDARREIASFEHERALRSADFQTPFKEQPTRLPLGDKPLLLARFSLHDKGDNGVVLSMHPASGQGVELALSRPLLHSFGKLVSDAARIAEWDLPSSLPATHGAPPGSVAH